MNYKRIAAIAESMENYSRMLRNGSVDMNEETMDEALDGIARAIERLEAFGLVVERKE